MIGERLQATDPLESYARAVNPQFVRLLRTIGFDRRWERASGAYLFDEAGDGYLDLLGGFGMFNVGRHNPRGGAALVEALELETPGSVQLGVSGLPGLLAEELLRRLPPRLGRVLFTNSGTEAVEGAVKIARAATGRPRVLSADHGFHGLTLGSLSANGCAEFTEPFGPLLPGFDRVRFNDADALERELAREDVAVFVVEPVQGKGVVLPEPGYLEAAQELCRRHGTLFCVDEVQTGLGRTGRMFAFEHWNLDPDMVTIAKSISGGYVPSGALVLRARDLEAVFDSLEHAVRHGAPFAPNDPAMAAGLAALAELDEQRLVERSRELGARLLERTRPLVERFGVVRDVRGLGLMWAIEFGEPPRGSRAWRAIERAQQGLFAQFVVIPLFSEHRILSQVAGRGLNLIKAIPPLVLDETDVDEFVDALDTVLAEAERIPRAAARFALKLAVSSLR